MNRDLISAINILKDFSSADIRDLLEKSTEELENIHSELLQDIKDDHINRECCRIIEKINEHPLDVNFFDEDIKNFLIDEHQIFHRERFDAILNATKSEDKKLYLLKYLKNNLYNY